MTSRRRRAVLVAGLALVLSCSSDDGEAVDPPAPLEEGEPAPDGFAATVAAATAGAGELDVEQTIVIGGEVLAESSGIIDLATGTARLDLVLQGPRGETRIEQVLEDGRMTERRVDQPGAQPGEVEASGGGPLQLPEGQAVDEATGVADALRAALALAPLVEHDPGDGRAASSCWAGDAPGTPPQRIEVCVDDDDVLRRLRWTTESSAGLVGVTTVTLTPPE